MSNSLNPNQARHFVGPKWVKVIKAARSVQHMKRVQFCRLPALTVHCFNVFDGHSIGSQGSMILEAENKDTDQTVDVQTDLNLH